MLEDWHPLADPMKDLSTGPNATPSANCTADLVVIELPRVDLVGLIEGPFLSMGGPLNLKTAVVPGAADEGAAGSSVRRLCLRSFWRAPAIEVSSSCELMHLGRSR